MNVKRIEIEFENCEVISLNTNMFKNLIFDEIYEQKIVNCYQYKNGENSVTKCCKYMSVEINKKGYEQRMEWQDITLKERLRISNDIVSIILIYEDESEEEIYMAWNEDDEYENKYQNVIEIDENIIKVLISEN